jgi:hypothetical protein
MNRQKFINLSQKQKKTALLRSGVFLAERKTAGGLCRVMLYEISNFYVEVFFIKWNKKPVAFRTFRSVDALQPYLRSIDLTSLLQNLYVQS